MLKKLLILSLIIILLPGVMLTQAKFEPAKKAPIVFEEQYVPSTRPDVPVTNEPNSSKSVNWIALDTMANSYGPAIAGPINPMAYDPYSDVVAIVYRGNQRTYAVSSGQLWYKISTNKGVSWTPRIPGGINTSIHRFARYPSMAISNPTKGPLSGTTALFSWPDLGPTGAGFGWVGYAADQPVGGGFPFAAFTDNNNYSSQVPCWASDNSNWMFWSSDHGTGGDNSYKLWRTEDFGTIQFLAPPTWSDTAFGSAGGITMGGVSHNGIQYKGSLGTFPRTAPIASGWYPAYSKSTDNGVTWSLFEVVDFRTIPALSAYDRLYDYKKGDAFVSYTADINVDMHGRVHFITALTDTTTDNNSGFNALVEIYQTATGWDGKVIAPITDSTFTRFSTADNNPGIGQMGFNGYLAFNKDRNFMVAQWVNGSPTAGDSLCDVYIAWRSLTGEWSAPMNLTNTNGKNENGSHLAPMLGETATKYIAFSSYWYETGYNGHVPITTNATVIYGAAVEINKTSVGEPVLPFTFGLEQNYPNPFNPSTLIKYSINQRSDVSLKVFDMLGREVATLVNTNLEAGLYSVDFNAANLASGLYVYTLKAGNSVSSKKMMLMK